MPRRSDAKLALVTSASGDGTAALDQLAGDQSTDDFRRGRFALYAQIARDLGIAWSPPFDLHEQPNEDQNLGVPSQENTRADTSSGGQDISARGLTGALG